MNYLSNKLISYLCIKLVYENILTLFLTTIEFPGPMTSAWWARPTLALSPGPNNKNIYIQNKILFINLTVTLVSSVNI